MKFLYAILFSLTVMLLPVMAQDVQIDSLAPQETEGMMKKSRGLIKTIDHLLNDLDTNYVSPNKYRFAFMLENSNWYEYYLFKTGGENPQSLTISPTMSYKLGAYIGWKWIFLGWSVDLKDLFKKGGEGGKKTEFGLSLYSSVVGGDIYYRKSGNNFKLRSTSGLFPHSTTPDYDKNITGFSVDIKGLNAYWVINHRRFSYPAAYSQSTNQRRNAGSLIAGFSFSQHQIHFDSEKLPSVILEQLDEALTFREIKYTDYSLSFGYAYNWVFARNCLASISLTPAVAYKRSEVAGVQKTSVLKNLNFDLITRAGVTYNNSNYFVGASLVMHTYDYKSANFYLNNSFGTIRIYAGFNFLKKKNKK